MATGMVKGTERNYKWIYNLYYEWRNDTGKCRQFYAIYFFGGHKLALDNKTLNKTEKTFITRVFF